MKITYGDKIKKEDSRGWDYPCLLRGKLNGLVYLALSGETGVCLGKQPFWGGSGYNFNLQTGWELYDGPITLENDR